MSIVQTVAEIVAPVFLLAATGFVWVRAGFDYPTVFVTRLAMSLATPCLVFAALMTSEIDPAALGDMALAALVAYAGMTVAMTLLVRVCRLDQRTYLAPLIFGNTGNLGLPLALFAFGDAGLGYAVAVFAVTSVASFTFGIWLVSGGASMTSFLREPLVGATLLGALFLWQGWQTPTFLTNAIELVGQLAIPLMLITLGVAMAGLSPRSLRRPTGLALAKVGAAAAIAGLTGLALGLPATAFAVLVLQVSTPVAVTSYMLARKYGADADAVAGLVVVSTLLSVIALPVLLAFLI
ncbi:hypothetical protein LX81_00527 [Palleronia aestuarii]|uniref:Auxin efflux carrier n=1 Tax=Palleronia aestuarii TaxID=568105 RepID=A0A2W7NQD8_9RHOB|nr:AEC family transporter [Palleronia aestuarii]PZX18834.1 hypothetical protein LX81_00527 [Palleronia aestuarii]